MIEDFVAYMHIERLGSDEVDGILDGACYVFPKIDGTNASVWLGSDEELHTGSRRREITPDDDNAGFAGWVQDHAELFMPLQRYPTMRVYGEWLVPHTLRTYRAEAWRQFYVFDVWDELNGVYLPYPEYEGLLAQNSGLVVIAPLEIVTNPSQEHLTAMLDRNTYLIADGNGSGEGIVIKRYDFENQWGRTVWAKMVRNEFKERNRDAFGVPAVEMGPSLEQSIAVEYVTRGRITKTLDKMRDEAPLTSRRIPELLGRVWNEIVSDEMWGIVKQHKNPTLDFRALNRAVIAETKRNCPELFG